MLVLKKKMDQKDYIWKERERENFKTFSILDWPELGDWERRLVVECLPSTFQAWVPYLALLPRTSNWKHFKVFRR